MEFLSYIKELMLKYECLIIPNFGAFITRDFKGGFKSDENLFLPPYKEIGFNSLLIDNDGILVDCIAKKNNIPYTDALINLQKEVDFLKKRLKNIPVIIDDIGELSINSNNKVIFNPFNSFNFNLHSFGLSTFKKIPIKIDYSSSNPNKSKIHYMEKSNEESFSFKPDKSIKKFNPLKYVAVGIISILIISFSYYLIDDYIDEKRIISAEKGQEKIKKNVQKAKFNLGSISPIEINLITEKKLYNVDLIFDGDEVLDVRLPAHVILKVIETEPGYKGNTATGALKPAKLETDYMINVPLFINEDDKIRVDTRTGAYVERYKNSI